MKRGKGFFCSFLIATAIAGAACNNEDDDNNTGVPNGTDVDFVMKASMGNTAEVDAGTAAAAKATDQGIKDYGNMMIADYGMAQTNLKRLADSLNMSAPDSLDAAHMQMKQMLANATGRQFDSLYIHGQIADHQTTISLFENEVSNGRNTALRQMAQQLLPSLNMHLQHADSLAAAY